MTDTEHIITVVGVYIFLGLIAAAGVYSLGKGFIEWVQTGIVYHRTYSKKAQRVAAQNAQITSFVQMRFLPVSDAKLWIAADLPYIRKLHCITAGMTVQQAYETLDWDDETVVAYGAMNKAKDLSLNNPFLMFENV